MDAGLHPAAGVLLQFHPARELPRDRHRLPAGQRAVAAVCLVPGVDGRGSRRRLLLPAGSGDPAVGEHLLHERHRRAGRRRRDDAPPAGALRHRRGVDGDGRAAHGARNGCARAAARLHAEHRRQPLRRARLRGHVVAGTSARGLVHARLRAGDPAARHAGAGQGFRRSRGNRHGAAAASVAPRGGAGRRRPAGCFADPRPRHGARRVVVAVLQDHRRPERHRHGRRGEQHLSPVDGPGRAEGILLPVAVHGLWRQLQERADSRRRLGHRRRCRVDARRRARRCRGDRPDDPPPRQGRCTPIIRSTIRASR